MGWWGSKLETVCTILDISIRKKYWERKEAWEIYVPESVMEFCPCDGFRGNFSFPCAFWFSIFTALSTLCNEEKQFFLKEMLLCQIVWWVLGGVRARQLPGWGQDTGGRASRPAAGKGNLLSDSTPVITLTALAHWEQSVSQIPSLLDTVFDGRSSSSD